MIGIRAGEKLHEELITKSVSLNVEEYNSFFIINPSYKAKKKKLKKIFEYNSQNNSKFLTPEEIKKLIKDNKKDFE